MRSIAGLPAVVLLLSVNACSGPGEAGAPSPTVVSVQGVKVTPQSIQWSAIGDMQQVFATIAPDNATDQRIIWESTDTTVATVSATGLVTANAAGSGVFVTASTHDGEHQESVNVTVNP